MDIYAEMKENGILSLLFIVSIGLSDGSKASSKENSKHLRSKRSDAENRWRGPKYKSEYWGTSQAFQTLGGLASYRQRELYKRDPSHEPTVCFNSRRPRNGYFAYFICPERFQTDDYYYCCGVDGEENCCNFWGDAGRIAGVVIGILIFLGLVGVGMFFLCKKKILPWWRERDVGKVDKHHNPTLDGVPLTSSTVSRNDYGDYPDLRRDGNEMQPVYKDAYRIPSDRRSRRSDTSEPHDYDIEPKRFHSEPYGYKSGSSRRSYDSEPRGYHPSETGSRRSRRTSDRESDLDTKHSFRDDEKFESVSDYEPVKHHSYGSKYSDFDTLGSPVAKHPPGLPPHNTAV